MDSVTITWYFHSFFTIACSGYSVAIDPYNPKMLGVPDVTVDANAVLCSHQHDDHNYIKAVNRVSFHKSSPFMIREIGSVHDGQSGGLRGKNTIFLLETGQLRIAHFGDQGDLLTPEQIEAIGKVDVCMVPTGGYYTIGAAEARAVSDAVNATVVIPMHYRVGDLGLSVLADISDIVTRFNNVVEYNSNRLVVTKDTPKQTAVLRYGASSTDTAPPSHL